MRRARGLWVLALVALLGGCAKLFPPPERPRTHGYTATLQGRIGERRFTLAVAIAPGQERRDFGNPGTRRSLILLSTRGEAIELDEAQRRAIVRPLGAGEELFRGYPFAPRLLAERQFPAGAMWRQLTDAGIGLHPCDVIRVDTKRDDGSRRGETLYFARDLDGLALRREVTAAAANEAETTIEIDELVDVDFPIDDDPFAIPEGYVVEKRASAEPVLDSLPPAH